MFTVLGKFPDNNNNSFLTARIIDISQNWYVDDLPQEFQIVPTYKFFTCFKNK